MSTATQTATEERLYRIGEVSRLSELKPFVLRYWETEFPMLEPVKSPSGHRMYRQEDVDMVFRSSACFMTKDSRLLVRGGICGRPVAQSEPRRRRILVVWRSPNMEVLPDLAILPARAATVRTVDTLKMPANC